MSSPSPTVDVERSGVVGADRGHDVSVTAAVLAGDRLLVVGQRGAGAGRLGDVVGAGVDGLGAGAVTVGGVRLGRDVGGALLDRQVEQARVVVGVQILLQLDLAGLADVERDADDVVAVADVDVQRTGRVGSDRGDRLTGAVLVLADDRLLVVGQVGAGAGGLGDVVGAGVDRGLTGCATVGGVVLGRRSSVAPCLIARSNRPGSSFG